MAGRPRLCRGRGEGPVRSLRSPGTDGRRDPFVALGRRCVGGASGLARLVRGGLSDFGHTFDRHGGAGNATAGGRHLRREAGPCRAWTVLHPRWLPDDRVPLLPAGGVAAAALAAKKPSACAVSDAAAGG